VSILTPQKTVRIGGVEITVRDLPWPVMKHFMEKLSAHLKATGAGVMDSSFFDQLPTITASASDLAEYLVSETCVVKETKVEGAWLQQRTATEFLTLLDAALEVVFNEEFVKLGKSVAERVQGAFSVPTATTLSARQSTSSSGKDGPTRTRVDSPLPNSNSSAT